MAHRRGMADRRSTLRSGCGPVTRARYAMRDPRFPKWPAPHSQRRATAPLGEIEVVNADHGNFIVLRDPACTDPYWDEVRLATDFFRDNGLGT